MAATGNLIPEPRMNKNGITAVKWVRPHSSGSDTSLGIPSPAVQKSESQRRKQIASTAKSIGMEPSEGYMLEPYSNLALEEIQSKSNSYDPRGPFLKRSVQRDDPEEFIRDYVHLVDEYERRISPDQLMTAPLRALSQENYPFLEPVIPGEPYPNSRAKQCLALIEAGERLEYLVGLKAVPADTISMRTSHNDAINPTYISNEPLARLFAEYTESTKEILAIIESRKTADVELILSVMEHDVKALSEGVL